MLFSLLMAISCLPQKESRSIEAILPAASHAQGYHFQDASSTIWIDISDSILVDGVELFPLLEDGTIPQTELQENLIPSLKKVLEEKRIAWEKESAVASETKGDKKPSLTVLLGMDKNLSSGLLSKVMYSVVSAESSIFGCWSKTKM